MENKTIEEIFRNALKENIEEISEERADKIFYRIRKEYEKRLNLENKNKYNFYNKN